MMIPAVLLWERETPDTLFASIIGALNVFLFGIFFSLLRKKYGFNGRLSQMRSAKSAENFLFPLIWGLGTVHYYISMQGDVWHLAQIIGQGFLITTGLLLLAQRPWLRYLAGVAFALACYTRLNLVTAAPFFVCMLWLERKTLREFAQRTFVSVVPYVFFSLCAFLYNKNRFDDGFEAGFSFMKMEIASGVAETVARYGKVSLSNISFNFFHELLSPPDFLREFPFIKMNPHGFGMFWATPFFLLLIPAVYRLYREYYAGHERDNRSRLALWALFTTALMAFAIFLLPGHGYQQYAARYTLDFQIFIFIAVGIFPGSHRRLYLWTLALASVAMNFIGALLFTRHFHLIAGVPD